MSKNSQIILWAMDRLLNLIHCKKDTPVAEIDAGRLEMLAQRAKRFWINQRQIGKDTEVSRICGLYLVPEEQETGLHEVVERKTK